MIDEVLPRGRQLFRNRLRNGDKRAISSLSFRGGRPKRAARRRASPESITPGAAEYGFRARSLRSRPGTTGRSMLTPASLFDQSALLARAERLVKAARAAGA